MVAFWVLQGRQHLSKQYPIYTGRGPSFSYILGILEKESLPQWLCDAHQCPISCQFPLAPQSGLRRHQTIRETVFGALIYCECDLDWEELAVVGQGWHQNYRLVGINQGFFGGSNCSFPWGMRRALIRNICIVLGFSSQFFILDWESYVPLVINVADTWLLW